MNKIAKVLLHTAVDAFELSNELQLRFIERTNAYKHYYGLIFRVAELRMEQEKLTALGEASNVMARALLDSMTLRCRELIDGDISLRDVVSGGTADCGTAVEHLTKASLDALAEDQSPQQTVN